MQSNFYHNLVEEINKKDIYLGKLTFTSLNGGRTFVNAEMLRRISTLSA